jgi:hypothetical protein
MKGHRLTQILTPREASAPQQPSLRRSAAAAAGAMARYLAETASEAAEARRKWENVARGGGGGGGGKLAGGGGDCGGRAGEAAAMAALAEAMNREVRGNERSLSFPLPPSEGKCSSGSQAIDCSFVFRGPAKGNDPLRLPHHGSCGDGGGGGRAKHSGRLEKGRRRPRERPDRRSRQLTSALLPSLIFARVPRLRAEHSS